MPPSSSRATPLPPEQRRAAIIAAAIPLVCHQGAAVTTREIAEAAGIAEGTIFRVFPDKDALITAVIGSVLDPGPYVAELRRIDPFDSIEQVLSQAVEAMRRRVERVWQIMWMLRISGPPGNEHDTSKFVQVTRPDLTEATATLAELLEPHGDQLRVPPLEAARLFRLITFSSAHPSITDGQPLATQEIVDLLLHGISQGMNEGINQGINQGINAEKSVAAESAQAGHSPAGAPDVEIFSRPDANHDVSSQPVGAQ